MNSRQMLKHAKENGFDSMMFEVKNGSGTHICCGKFLDAYYEFVTIPFLGNGFVRISDLEEQIGYDIQFDEIDKSAYLSGVFLDFVLRGKEAPKDISDELAVMNQSNIL